MLDTEKPNLFAVFISEDVVPTMDTKESKLTLQEVHACPGEANTTKEKFHRKYLRKVDAPVTEHKEKP